VPVDASSGQAVRRVGAGWVAAVALLVLFALLTALVVAGWRPLHDLDVLTVGAAQPFVLARPGLLRATLITTDAGSPLSISVLTVVLAGVFLVRQRVRAAVFIVAARLLELGVETAMKNLVERPRPLLPDPIRVAGSFSFPSGHTAGTAVFCVSLLVLTLPAMSGRWRPVAVASAVVAVAAVASSRVLLGVHYPSDVLGGALLGTACALLLAPVLVVPLVSR
jgi:undecaprenyl-diphosphatase